MREIKFRAWDPKDARIVEVMDISFNGDRSLYSIKQRGFSNTGGMYLYPKNDVVLMEYTGLKDKNGKNEIYEGDIIEVEQDEGTSEYPNWVKRRDKVEFSGGCSFGIFNEPLYTLTKSDGFVDALVIGNIYENPDLLKV